MRSPRILYGTAWKKDDTARLVSTAIGQGFRGFDTACQPKHYDEAGVGAGVAACLHGGVRGGLHGGLARADLYLQTKFTALSGQDPKRVPYDPKAPLVLQVAQSFDASLRNLQTDYVDGLILHSPLASAELTLEVWRAFERLVDSGHVRQLGLSNCAQLPLLELLYGAARIKPAIIQNRFYAATGYDRELRSYCRRHQIVYQSFWTLTANPQLLGDSAIITLASKYHRTPAQVLCRYLTQTDIVPLTGTRSETHMREDLAIFEFELTEPECRSLEALC
jgi:diketogulonate reductase-like aldo/keto reductase